MNLLVTLLSCVVSVFGSFQFNADESLEDFSFQQIAIDNTSGDDVIFVAGTNRLYHLDANLSLVEEFTTGPKPDNPHCPAPPGKCNQELKTTDNDPKILTVDKKTGSLLFCGSVHQGVCTRHSVKNISRATVFDGRNLTNYAGGSLASIGFFAPWLCNVDNKTYKLSGFYVAMTYDSRPFDLFPKAISTRILRSTGDEGFNLKYI
jgi:hypothetical protein